VKNGAVLAGALALLIPSIGLGYQKPNLMAKPPKNAIVLFDGKDASQWHQRNGGATCQWDIVDGNLIVKNGTGDIVTNQEFGDYRLHLEFWLPLLANKTSQERANSGVYNHGRYEIQVLDSYNNPTYKFGGCGALYSQKDPDKDAIIPPENWNSYDITFTAPKLDATGKVVAYPRITVFHNGIKIHDKVEIKVSSTASGMAGEQPAKGPIMLQDHGAPVRYRNVWIVPMNPKGR